MSLPDLFNSADVSAEFNLHRFCISFSLILLVRILKDMSSLPRYYSAANILSKRHCLELPEPRSMTKMAQWKMVAFQRRTTNYSQHKFVIGAERNKPNEISSDRLVLSAGMSTIYKPFIPSLG